MSARILIVDDNPLNLKLLAAKLAHDYYMVTMAENGEEALRKIHDEKPDIVLLDVMMPGMNGFEVCQKIKDDPTTAHIPVVMVTALSDVSDRVRGLEAGADDFLTKPINDLALMARVRSLIRLKTIMDEWRLREATSSHFLPALLPEYQLPQQPQGGRALLLENDPAEQHFIRETLARIGVQVIFTGTIAETVTMAHTGDYDLVLVSPELKNEDGLLICPQLRTHETTRQLPILLIANDSEMGPVARWLDLGANDYLIRPLDPNELIARIRTQLRQKLHYDRLHKNYESSLALALVDPLTGAFNRRYFDAHVPRLLSRINIAQKSLSVLMIDIDHFKTVNDTYGHAVGDIVLRDVVRRLTLAVRPTDLLVRMGGEEFAVIMPETDLSAALVIAERLRERIATSPIAIKDKKNQTLTVTVSIGCACRAPTSDDSVDTLVLRADTALLQAKKEGRNRVINGEQTEETSPP